MYSGALSYQLVMLDCFSTEVNLPLGLHIAVSPNLGDSSWGGNITLSITKLVKKILL